MERIHSFFGTPILCDPDLHGGVGTLDLNSHRTGSPAKMTDHETRSAVISNIDPNLGPDIGCVFGRISALHNLKTSVLVTVHLIRIGERRIKIAGCHPIGFVLDIYVATRGLESTRYLF